MLRDAAPEFHAGDVAKQQHRVCHFARADGVRAQATAEERPFRQRLVMNEGRRLTSYVGLQAPA